jgi:hypothetical protein
MKAGIRDSVQRMRLLEQPRALNENRLVFVLLDRLLKDWIDR